MYQVSINLLAYSGQNLLESVFYWLLFGIIVFGLHNFIGNSSLLVGQKVF